MGKMVIFFPMQLDCAKAAMGDDIPHGSGIMIDKDTHGCDKGWKRINDLFSFKRRNVTRTLFMKNKSNSPGASPSRSRSIQFTGNSTNFNAYHTSLPLFLYRYPVNA